jgi:hypothetical protein
LEIDRKRRFLAVIPFLIIVLTASFFASRAGLTDYTAAIVAFALWLPFFLMVDRAAVVERCGFRCKTCGYDLQGQVAPRCPECGREFDDEERAFLETGVAPTQTSGRRRAAWIGVVVIGLILVSTLVTGVLYYFTVTGTGVRPAATHPAPSPADDAP